MGVPFTNGESLETGLEVEEHLPAAEPRFWGLQLVSCTSGPSEQICWREDDSLPQSTPSQCHSDASLHRIKPEDKRTNSPKSPAFPLFLTFFSTRYLGDWEVRLNYSCCWWAVTHSPSPSLGPLLLWRQSLVGGHPARPERTLAHTQKQGVFLWFR